MAAKSEWAEFFNRHAPVYEQNVFTKNTIAEVDFLVRELEIEPGADVLDVGCGTGRHSIELARRGFKVTGLDISAGMLEQAASRAGAAGVHVNWIQSDAASFSLPERFDAAVCLCEGAFGLLSTTDDPIEQPLAILRNLGSALKPGAGCIFTVLNGYKMARQHTLADVESGAFDPAALCERSDVVPPDVVPPDGTPPGATHALPLREKGFVPTELSLLFRLAGLQVRATWGGTAGNWGRRPIELDEYEIMVVARKASPSASSPK